VASPELLRRLAQTLERLDIPYLITGSVATIYWGEPRLTRDVDVVVQIALRDVERLVAAFPAPEFYMSDEAAVQAVRRRGQFNVIQPATGLKIDVMVAVMDDFDRSRFARLHRVDLGGFEANIAAPDDAILKKLVYYREGGSDKHLRDIGGVVQVSGERVDREYVASWAERLGVVAEWQLVLDALAARRGG
jgi:hypothetical protein